MFAAVWVHYGWCWGSLGKSRGSGYHRGLSAVALRRPERIPAAADAYVPFAGQSVGLIHDIRSARDIITATVAQADQILRHLTVDSGTGPDCVVGTATAAGG